MKICLITDSHFGVRNDNLAVQTYFERFYSDVFFPSLEAERPDLILHLGDLVDRRKYINFNIANRMRQCFLTPLSHFCYMHGTRAWVLAGNHDTFYKDTNDINALQELGVGGAHIHTITRPTYDKASNFAFFPWICSENEGQSMELLKSLPDRTHIFGHFEMNGVEMHRGSFSQHGIEPSEFSRFTRVFSGHFHKKSTLYNIEYLGAPYEMTWNDYDCPRGFHYYDTRTNGLRFIKNPYSLFHKIVYDDSNFDLLPDFLDKFDFTVYSNTFCKLVVKQKTNPFWFDAFVRRLEDSQPADLKIVEESMFIEFGSDDEIGQSVDDPLTILKKHCRSEKHPELVEAKLTELYNQSLLIVD